MNNKEQEQPIAKFPNIDGEKNVWGVWNNTDLTEGRGGMYVQYVCELKATAIRLAKNAGIQGCDADVIPLKGYLINNNWHYRCKLISPNQADIEKEKQLKQEAELKERQEKVLLKAVQLGLSQQDIEILRGMK